MNFLFSSEFYDKCLDNEMTDIKNFYHLHNLIKIKCFDPLPIDHL